MKLIVENFVLLFAVLLFSCTPFTREHRELIGKKSDGIMRVLQVTNNEDSLFLRGMARDLSLNEISSEEMEILQHRMLLTVNDPEHPGVGIAAPQVGLPFKLVAVKRYDRENREFEFFANPKIVKYSETKTLGPEGCLSVPNLRGMVYRSDSLVVSYVNPKTLETKLDTITGFTAVIFQHETDHLSGNLYSDKAESLSPEEE